MSALEPGQNPVFEVPLKAFKQVRKILRIADILGRQSRMNPLSQFEHLVLLLLNKLKHHLVDCLQRCGLRARQNQATAVAGS